MSKFMLLLEDAGYDERNHNPIEGLDEDMPNYRTMMSAVIEDILGKYSSIFDEALERGVIFDFEASIKIPTEGVKFNLLDQIEWHKQDMEIKE